MSGCLWKAGHIVLCKFPRRLLVLRNDVNKEMTVFIFSLSLALQDYGSDDDEDKESAAAVQESATPADSSHRQQAPPSTSAANSEVQGTPALSAIPTSKGTVTHQQPQQADKQPHAALHPQPAAPQLHSRGGVRARGMP